MCWIACYESDQEVREDFIDNAWKVNQDGAGIMYTVDGEIAIEKGFFDLEEFKEVVRETRITFPDSPIVIHLRFASKGVIDHDNTHPFRIGGDIGMSHNGTIHSIDTVGDESDTAAMAKLLENLPDGWLDVPVYQKIVEEYIGTSKLVFLRGDEIIIYNDDLGEWGTQGEWYSNGYHVGEWTRSKTGAAKKSVVYSHNNGHGYKRKVSHCKKCGKIMSTYEAVGSDECYNCRYETN